MVKLSVVSLIAPLLWIGIGVLILFLEAPSYYFGVNIVPPRDLIEIYGFISIFVFPGIIVFSIVAAIVSLMKESNRGLAFASLTLNVLYLVGGWIYLKYFFRM